MQVYMQLVLFFQALQMTHNILVIAWHNFQASRNSSFPSLRGKHDPQHWTHYSPYAYLCSFSICHVLLSDYAWSLPPLAPFPRAIPVQAQLCSLDYPKSQVSYTFFHTKLHTDSSPRIPIVHCYKQTLPSVSNHPTWLVCPSYTCKACLPTLNSVSMSSHQSEDGRKYWSSTWYSNMQTNPSKNLKWN